MPTSPLHGLNLVQPDSPADSTAAAAGAQADLLAAHHFPDLAAQLDLWSTLNFQSDDRASGQSPALGDDRDEDDGEPDGPGPASLEGHVNAVNPAPTATISSSSSSTTRKTNLTSSSTATAAKGNETAAAPAQLAFPATIPSLQPGTDVNAILASFGIDPYLVPQVPTHQTPASASLAQLIAAYPFAHPPFLPSHLQTQSQNAVPPSALSNAPGVQQQQQQQQRTNPDAKKARTRKTSLAVDPSLTLDEAPEDISTPTSPTSPTSSLSTPSTQHPNQNITPAEDKRKRNTAASARFRMKKKEREAALEKRAAELESRVSALERECEGLRRENGWLKGLVIGVTGASQGAVVQGLPQQQQQQQQGQQNQQAAAPGKRKRDEVEVEAA